MTISLAFEQTSKKKRRWQVRSIYGYRTWDTDACAKIENVLFAAFNKCRILKECIVHAYPSPWYELYVEFKNDADEAAFIMCVSSETRQI